MESFCYLFCCFWDERAEKNSDVFDGVGYLPQDFCIVGFPRFVGLQVGVGEIYKSKDFIKGLVEFVVVEEPFGVLYCVCRF